MAFSDPPNDLEHLIADAMGPALEGARRSLAEQIRRKSAADARSARERGLGELRESIARLDGARDQAEVLQALLEEAARFASRTALLLTFVDGARGWAAHGFAGNAQGVEDLRLGYDEPFLRELAQGRGTVTLDATEAAALAARLGGNGASAGPREAVLVPLVLRDRVAAALYADRTRDEDALLVAALQLLTLTAAHLLELQGTRERAATPTLATAAAATAVGLPLWDPAAVDSTPAPAAPAAAAPTPEPLAEPAAEPVVTESAQPALEEPVSPSWEPQPSSPAEPAWVESPTTELAPATHEPQWQMDEEPTASTVAPMPSAVEPAASGEEAWVYTDQSAAGAEATSYEEIEAQGYGETDIEELPALPEPELPALPEPEPEPPAQAAEPALEPWREPTESWRPPVIAPPVMTPADAQTSQLHPSAPEPSPVYPSEATVRISRDLLPTAAPPVVPAPPPAEADISDDRTVMLHRQSAATPAPAPPAPPPAPARDELDETHTRPQAAQPRQAPVFGGVGGGGGSTEVQPPPDLEGPGWAFRAESMPAATAPHRQMNEETSALHEEARRLARLLVSEIKLYNEEQVEEGRRQRDVYPRLQEDIDRSRQMYEERVDPRVRDEVDYFQQELVNILAGGDAGALGL